jgi:adenosine deaminase
MVIDDSTDPYRLLPKVELHCHIEGTMRRATLAELTGHEPEHDGYSFDNLAGFLDVFWSVQAALTTPDHWERLATESIVDGADHGLRYREAFFTPARHLAAGQRLADIVAALDRGLAAAERSTGVRCRLILDFDRDFGPSVALANMHELIALRRSGAPGAERVIGVGMDSTEAGIDPTSYLAAYELAPRAGLRRTAHQGENSDASAIAAAVDVLGCERIDHGISVLGDRELASRLADAQLPFTVCPNANVRINPDVCADLASHVFPEMRAAGLFVTLNTDDPALVGLDLTEEYRLSAAAFGYEFDEMVDIALDAVRASWLDDSDRSALLADMRAESAPPST